jgi:hypothetical protein
MSGQYKQLHEYCQTLNPKIKSGMIKNKILDLVGKERISTTYTGLDMGTQKGAFLSLRNGGSHRIVQQLGTDVIVLARGMNTCWRRFVFVKELMHLFDSDEEKVNTPEGFDVLLDEFSGSSSPSEKTDAYISELKAFWMALGCFCPEHMRKAYKEQLDKGHIDDYGIALQLKIPQQHVKKLVSDRYDLIIKNMLEI